MTTVCIEASYHAGVSAHVDLPEGKTWEDIQDWYVKWDTFHFVLKGETDWREKDLNSCALEAIDWKRPQNVTIYPVDDEGEVNYGVELAEK